MAQYRRTWQADDAPEAYRLAAQARKQHEMDSNPKRIDISVSVKLLFYTAHYFPVSKGDKVHTELFVAVPNPKLDHQAAKVAPRDVAAQLCLGRASLKLGRQDTFSAFFCLFIQ